MASTWSNNSSSLTEFAPKLQGFVTASAKFTRQVLAKRDDVSEATIGAKYSTQTCVMMWPDMQRHCLLPLLWFALWFGGHASASLGDRLPEFKSCVAVRFELARGWNEVTLLRLLSTGLRERELRRHWHQHTYATGTPSF